MPFMIRDSNSQAGEKVLSSGVLSILNFLAVRKLKRATWFKVSLDRADFVESSLVI